MKYKSSVTSQENRTGPAGHLPVLRVACFMIRKPRRQAGFTAVELVIAVAIAGLLAAIVAVSLSTFISRKGVDAAAIDLVAFLDQARTQSVTSLGGTVYGIHFATSSATRFVGSTYTAGTSTNVTLTFPAGVTIGNISLVGGDVDVVFSRITGTTTQSGTISLIQQYNGTTTNRTITIYKTGVAELQ